MRHAILSTKAFSLGLCAAAMFGCQPAAAPQAQTQAAAESQFRVTAGIKDIMAFMIDPAADALWASVSTEQSAKGEVVHQPKTDEEWKTVRGHAVTLMESSNLLVMDGRHVAMEGTHLEDTGTPGNLTAEQSQQAIDANRAAFVGFAHALHDVGAQMLKAASDKNPQALMEAGATLDNVCEGCHLKFWYPGQKIPLFKNQAPEEDLKK